MNKADSVNGDIEKVLSFIVEIEKLKDVKRKTRPVGLDRYENSAEHSWHVCISALMLKEFADKPINIDRVIKMLLIHDLGEIDAGDTIIYQSETQEMKQKEAAGLKRILDILPEGQADTYMDLWYEFELGETADASFAKAIDRVPPLLHNLHGEGHSWRDNNVPKEKVFSVNRRIAKGSEGLWSSLENKLSGAVETGLIK
ncbi:putative HD superfamily hydrolase [Shewanella psychrophila]|uniref:Putative HD superfamily hydrolase n=1 Tax=Shewanella psychrophila TaxID=225848 RepID=A0A1S6HQJ4_9GAMM|nr:HD domain-containing protein [Shewanella psychrophila]AQS37817.1 putative HD superfamily hydrolase [Shewanella psychrophila]